MRQNMGKLDRTIRLLLAIVVVVLYATEQISGTAAIVLGILAAVFVLTSATGFCPLYAPLGIDTSGGGGTEQSD